MIFKRMMRNDQCSMVPPGSIKLSAVPPGSPSRTRVKMPMVKTSTLTTCLRIQEADFSAARKAPTGIKKTRTSDAPLACRGSTKTIPSIIELQSANIARLASSRKTAQQYCARRARPVTNRAKPPRHFAFPASLESTRMRQEEHAAKSAKLVDIKLN